MKLTLTATAAGLAFAFGSTVSMANTQAWVDQTGNSNVAVVEQVNNDNVGAYINVTGNSNHTTIEQSDNQGVNGTINVTGWAYGNKAVIVTENVRTGDAAINQSADKGKATINQHGSSGKWGKDAENLYATINQTSGYRNTAWITQTDKNQDAIITQSGKYNVGGIEQSGNGSFNVARLTQDGYRNDGYILQRGNGLEATVAQFGSRNVAVVDQRGSSLSTNVTQTGHGNDAYVRQR